MEWYHVIAIVFGNITWILPIFFWVRAESRADIRHMDAKIDSIRDLTYAIHMEVKDFHEKLFEIEKSKLR